MDELAEYKREASAWQKAWRQKEAECRRESHTLAHLVDFLWQSIDSVVDGYVIEAMLEDLGLIQSIPAPEDGDEWEKGDPVNVLTDRGSALIKLANPGMEA